MVIQRQISTMCMTSHLSLFKFLGVYLRKFGVSLCAAERWRRHRNSRTLFPHPITTKHGQYANVGENRRLSTCIGQLRQQSITRYPEPEVETKRGYLCSPGHRGSLVSVEVIRKRTKTYLQEDL